MATKFGGGWLAVGLDALVVGLVASESNARKRRLRDDEDLRGAREFETSTLHEVCRVFRISPLAIVFTDSTANAESGSAKVLINLPWYLCLLKSQCDETACYLTVARWVLAHEVAQHVHGDALLPLWIRDHHAQELRADYFSGRALAHLGDKAESLDGVLMVIAPMHTTSHPAFSVQTPRLSRGLQRLRWRAGFRVAPADLNSESVVLTNSHSTPLTDFKRPAAASRTGRACRDS